MTSPRMNRRPEMNQIKWIVGGVVLLVLLFAIRNAIYSGIGSQRTDMEPENDDLPWPTGPAILVTGGAGYIGSHTIVELLSKNYRVICVDNYFNSKPESLRRVQDITKKRIRIYHADLLDAKKVDEIFDENKDIFGVIHFAGYKAVGESVEKPLRYYHNNIMSTRNLLESMQRHKVGNLVFSSSATVYGLPEYLPLNETARVGFGIPNPYGRTKFFIEEMSRDLCVTNQFSSEFQWNIVLLRYFNPVGAHISGRIGEDPNDIPNNLMPYVTQVAVGKRDHVRIWGDDYPTKDGTGVRDYIHVVDLAMGHVASLKLFEQKQVGCHVYNLGTGTGSSVYDVIKSMEKAVGRRINTKIYPRRPGDVASNWADPSKAQRDLGWKAALDLDRMCADAWRWQSQNPNGYTDQEVLPSH